MNPTYYVNPDFKKLNDSFLLKEGMSTKGMI